MKNYTDKEKAEYYKNRYLTYKYLVKDILTMILGRYPDKDIVQGIAALTVPDKESGNIEVNKNKEE